MMKSQQNISNVKVNFTGFDAENDQLSFALKEADFLPQQFNSIEELSNEINGSKNTELLLIKYLGSTNEVLNSLSNLTENKLQARCDIILYAPQADKTLVSECAKYNIYTVLCEETAVQNLCSIAQSVHMAMEQTNQLQNEVMQRSSAIGYIKSGEFEVCEPSEAFNLATMLSVACPDPKTIALGLFELITNGIEHGNLGIGYNLKTKLLRERKYKEEIEARLIDPKHKDKRVIVSFMRTDDKIKFTIKDQGNGFDPSPYLQFDPKRIMDPHGRGIAMTVASSFDKVRYNDIGNQVTCELHI